MDKNCIFCKINKGEIPSNTVYEDDDFKAILDNGPANKGHVIILTKRHCVNLFDLDETSAKRALIVAQKIAKALQEDLGCDGINMLQNNGEAAGQSVFHYHIHLIPRYDQDKVEISWEKVGYQEGEAEKLGERLSEKIKRSL